MLPVKRHSFVFYVADAGLYGLMQVNEVRRDGRIVCRVDMDREGVFTYEIFEPEELEVTERAHAAV